MNAIVDFEGAAGTVRARIYAGTSASGTLLADVTNRVGVPASLAAGTVFGFTAATTANTQLTYIEDLSVHIASALTPGPSFTLQSFTAAPWNATSGVTSFSGAFAPGGANVTMTFANPKTGVNITNPSAPDASGAVASFFGFESTGFGVGNTGLGRFERGESFTLRATQPFALQTIRWYECNGDEQVHLAWTQNGQPQQQLISIAAGSSVIISSLTGVHADANTDIVITNVSPNTNLSGRLRLNYVTGAVLPVMGGSTG